MTNKSLAHNFYLLEFSVFKMYFLIFFAFFLGVFFKVSANKPIDSNQGIYAPKQTSKVKKSNNNFVMKPRQLGHDSRFKSFSYTPNVTFEIVALYDNSSYIEFEQDETITTIVNPKKLAWQLVPAGNRLFIKPEESDANTSITIFTNKRRYFFEFSAKEPTETFDPDHTFFFQFKYPTDEDAKNIRNYAKSILPDVDQSPWKYNFNYTITGEDTGHIARDLNVEMQRVKQSALQSDEYLARNTGLRKINQLQSA